jgi:hypothetical protein
MNHKYDIDWLVAWMACQRLGILKVNLKLFVLNIFFIDVIFVRVQKLLLNNLLN